MNNGLSPSPGKALVHPDPVLTFVIPWYGARIPGGAETLCREWAEHLTGAGFRVEVLTTTIKEFQSNWNQPFHSVGNSVVNGVTLRRFELTPGNHSIFNEINQKLLAGLKISAEEELAFLTHSANSYSMTRFIHQNRNDRVFLFIPYMFGTTYWGVRTAADRAVLIPCLHDEPYARLGVMRGIFETVPRLIFNSHPERLLAESLYSIAGRSSVVLGMGLELEKRGDAAAFQRRFGQKRPFLLYVGRRDATKNTGLLMDYFKLYKRLNPLSSLQLVLIGRGEVDSTHPDIRDLGFVKEKHKLDAHAAAMLLCNPSVHESFSIVLMESWLCGTPVLVHADCAVTRDFVERGKGGLYFHDYFEFEACLNVMAERPELGERMAASGRELVVRTFGWVKLIEQFNGFVGF